MQRRHRPLFVGTALVLGGTETVIAVFAQVVPPATSVPAAAAFAPEPVRVSYDAPPECPSRDAFLVQVRTRVGSNWEAPPEALARTLEVRVLSDGSHSVARIDYVDESGKAVSRSVAAVTCDEVVSGIALVTALALESRFPRREASGDLPPVLPRPEPAPVFLAPPRLLPVLPPPAPVPHFDVGVGFLGAFGLGGPMGLGARAFFGTGWWEHGPDFRLGLDVARAPKFDFEGTTQNRISLYAGRASACPFAWGDRLRVLPCLGLAAGVLHAESFDSTVITGASGNAAFVAPFASLRADASLEAAFVEVEAEGRFPLDGHTFTYANPPKPVYQEPLLAFGFSVAVGLRL